MTQYQLPCECGRYVLIEPTQAGESVVCQCGRKLQVPALRALRQLASVQVDSLPPAAPRWTPAQGLLFACGVLVIVVSLISAGYSHLRRLQFAVTPPSEEDRGGLRRGSRHLVSGSAVEVLERKPEPTVSSAVFRRWSSSSARRPPTTEPCSTVSPPWRPACFCWLCRPSSIGGLRTQR